MFSNELIQSSWISEDLMSDLFAFTLNISYKDWILVSSFYYLVHELIFCMKNVKIRFCFFPRAENLRL